MLKNIPKQLKKYQKYVIKHIFLLFFLHGLKKSSTFAPCFSWY